MTIIEYTSVKYVYEKKNEKKKKSLTEFNMTINCIFIVKKLMVLRPTPQESSLTAPS